MTSAARFALLALCSSLALNAWAGVSVQAPWVRATVSPAMPSGAFMQIRSDTATRLIEARSPVAKTVQIHEMSMVGDVMKMRAIKGLDIPAGQAVELKPGSYHLMLLDMDRAIKEGDTVPLTLVFESADKKRETLEIKAPARALTRPTEHGAMHNAAHHHAP